MNHRTRIAGTGLVLMLASCGSDGGSPPVAVAPPVAGQPAPPPPPAPSAPVLAGTWYGELGDDIGGSTEVTAWVSEDQRFRFVWFDWLTWEHDDRLLTGTIDLLADGFSGRGLAYAGNGNTWSDGSSISELVVEGVLSGPSPQDGSVTLTGTWTTSSGDGGYFEFFQTWGYRGSDSNPHHLAGKWRTYDVANAVTARIDVDTDGAFSGTDDSGCTLAGRFAPIDVRFNLFDVRTTISDCDVAGEYVGFASRDGWYDAFHYSADDGNRSVVLTFVRDTG